MPSARWFVHVEEKKCLKLQTYVFNAWGSVTISKCWSPRGCAKTNQSLFLAARRFLRSSPGSPHKSLSASTHLHQFIESLELEGTFKGHLAQPHCSEQGHLQLAQGAQSNLRFRGSEGGGEHSFFSSVLSPVCDPSLGDGTKMQRPQDLPWSTTSC
mgnify:CR=1 FL=1